MPPAASIRLDAADKAARLLIPKDLTGPVRAPNALILIVRACGCAAQGPASNTPVARANIDVPMRALPVRMRFSMTVLPAYRPAPANVSATAELSMRPPAYHRGRDVFQVPHHRSSLFAVGPGTSGHADGIARWSVPSGRRAGADGQPVSSGSQRTPCEADDGADVDQGERGPSSLLSNRQARGRPCARGIGRSQSTDETYTSTGRCYGPRASICSNLLRPPRGPACRPDG